MNMIDKNKDYLIITATIERNLEWLMSQIPESVKSTLARDLMICEKRKESNLSFQQLGIKFRVSKTTAWRVCQSCL